MRHAGAFVHFGSEECNADIPSDECARGAHGRLQYAVYEEPGEYKLIAVLVMWFPSTYADMIEGQQLTTARHSFQVDLLHGCTAAANGLQRGTGFRNAAHLFMNCIIVRAARLPFFEVAAAGQRIATQMSANGGCIFSDSTPHGDVVVLPKLNN